MASVGNLNFQLSLDRELFKRQMAETSRTAVTQGKASGAGYGRNFAQSADLKSGVDKSLRSTIPGVTSSGKQAGITYKDAFNRNCKPAVAVYVDYSVASRKGAEFANALKGNFAGLGTTFQSIMAGAAAAVASHLISVVGGAISTVVGSIKSSITEIYRVGSAAEATKVSLTAVVGDATKAQAIIKDVQKISAATPFTSGELLGAAKGLIATGTGLSQVATTITNIGNAAALARQEGQSLGDSFKEVSNVYAKIQSVGKLTGETDAQLLERSLNIHKEIAAVMGVQESQVTDLISAGKVSAEVFQKAFTAYTTGTGQAAGQMDALSKTTEGLWSTFQEGVEQSAAAIFNSVQPALNEVIKQIGDATAKTAETSTAMYSLGQIANSFTEYLKQNPQVIQAITQAVSDLVDEGMRDLVGEAESLLQYLRENPKWIEEAIKNTKDFLTSMNGVFTTVGQLVSGFTMIASKLKEAWDWADKLGRTIASISPINLVNGSLVPDITPDGTEALNASGQPISSRASLGGTLPGGVGSGYTLAPNNQKLTTPHGAPLNNSSQLEKHWDGKERGLSGMPKRDITIRSKATGSYDSQPIKSPLNGVVESAKANNGDAGNMLTLKGDDGQRIILMHLKSFAVKAGQRVVEGMAVGIQGFTGSPKGRENTHVHVEASLKLMDKFIKINSGTLTPNSTGQSPATVATPPRANSSLTYQQGFLAAIRHGESDGAGGSNAVNKKSGARGAYQFMKPTRDSILAKYGYDAYGTPDQQDKAALALIRDEDKRKGQNSMQLINQGDYRGAAKNLRSQWSSLPGALEEKKWKGLDINSFRPNTRAVAAQAGITVAPTTPTVVSKAQAAVDAKKKANDALYVSNKHKADAELKKKAEDAAKDAVAARKALDEEVAKGITDSNKSLQEAQSNLAKLNDDSKSKLDSEIKSIQEKYKGINDDLEGNISEQRLLLDKAKDPAQRKQIEGALKGYDALIAQSKKQMGDEIKTRELALMMENTKKAEEALAAARAKRVEDEQAYNNALFEYLAAQKQKGEQIKAAIKQYQENDYQGKKTAALGIASMQSSDASVLSAKAANTTDINKAAGLNREAGLLTIESDTTNQISALEDLKRSGELTNLQFEKMKANVMELGQMRVDGLKDQFKDLGGVIGEELQGAVGNFLTAVLTGSQTAGEALKGLVNQLLSALGNLAIKQLLGGLLGGAGGGGIGSMLGFAGGTGGTVGDAFKRERKESMGRKPLLAVLNESEMVLSASQTKDYQKMMSGGGLFNLAAGSMPSMPTMSSGIGSGGGNNITQNISIPESTSKTDRAALSKDLESAVVAVLLKHQTSAGGLLRR